jgi:hypothetical protein
MTFKYIWVILVATSGILSSGFGIFSNIKANSINTITFANNSSKIPENYQAVYSEKTEGGIKVMTYGLVEKSANNNNTNSTSNAFASEDQDKISNFFGNPRFVYNQNRNSYYVNYVSSSTSSSSDSSYGSVRIMTIPGK